MALGGSLGRVRYLLRRWRTSVDLRGRWGTGGRRLLFDGRPWSGVVLSRSGRGIELICRHVLAVDKRRGAESDLCGQTPKVTGYDRAGLVADLAVASGRDRGLPALQGSALAPGVSLPRFEDDGDGQRAVGWPEDEVRQPGAMAALVCDRDLPALTLDGEFAR